MCLPDTAEYWWDVKRPRRPYQGRDFYHIPKAECGHRHLFEAKSLAEINCFACLKLIEEGYDHKLPPETIEEPNLMGELLKVEGTPALGESYHVSWGAKGVMGVCTMVDALNKLVELKRPKTRQAFANLIPWSDLRHTRTQEARIRKFGTPYPDRTHDPRHKRRMEKFKLI